MILIVGAFVLLAVAVAFALQRTRSEAQVSRDGIAGRIHDNINIALVPSDGGLILDVGSLPIASPEPEPTPAP